MARSLVEALRRARETYRMGEKVGLDDGLEGGLGVRSDAQAAIRFSFWFSNEMATWQYGARTPSPSIRLSRSRTNRSRGAGPPIPGFLTLPPVENSVENSRAIVLEHWRD